MQTRRVQRETGWHLVEGGHAGVRDGGVDAVAEGGAHEYDLKTRQTVTLQLGDRVLEQLPAAQATSLRQRRRPLRLSIAAVNGGAVAQHHERSG
jgi:hypothetical protein